MFKVGDTVKIVEEYGGSPKIGKVGTIIHIYSDGDCGVEFTENIHGHNCNHHGREGYCWYFSSRALTLKVEFKKEIKVYGIVKFMESIAK